MIFKVPFPVGRLIYQFVLHWDALALHINVLLLWDCHLNIIEELINGLIISSSLQIIFPYKTVICQGREKVWPDIAARLVNLKFAGQMPDEQRQFAGL